MKMHTESINILTEKRAALEAGDDAMVRAMGEGKDIMSILCQSLCFFFTAPFVMANTCGTGTSACQYGCFGGRQASRG